jgi:murein DD-endopeptidase MepM/ murein hydrolase activator NlpD
MRIKLTLGALLLSISTGNAFGGDTPNKHASAPFPALEEIKIATIPSEEELGGEFVFDWPLENPNITSGFGKRRDPVRPKKKKVRLHAGLDLEGDTGDLIMSTGPGKVLYAGWNSGYGNYVLIQHTNGYRSHYGHLSEILVYRGQMVRQDAPIGLIGNTGHSTGAHLHFGITKDGSWVNPAKYIGANSATGIKEEETK